jgi:hypothetical protein
VTAELPHGGDPGTILTKHRTPRGIHTQNFNHPLAGEGLNVSVPARDAQSARGGRIILSGER